MPHLNSIALVVASGNGTRFGGGIPKQYQSVPVEHTEDSKTSPILNLALTPFLHCSDIHAIQIVISKKHQHLYEKSLKILEKTTPHLSKKILPPVFGGSDRQASVFAGLKKIAPLSPSHVLVHDAARPFLSLSLLNALLHALKEGKEAVLPVVPVQDSLLKAETSPLTQSGQSQMLCAVQRENLYHAQTPQAFSFLPFFKAHQAFQKTQHDAPSFTDDASLAKKAGLTVHLITGDPLNKKITYPDDHVMVPSTVPLTETRVGSGYDVHALKSGTEIILGGVKIPHTQSLEGHSDADVGLHALTDAFLGALAEGDIGTHFPPSDPQWRGADSGTLLQKVLPLLEKHEGRITSVDLGFICETPKIGPYREAMQKRISNLLSISPSRVSVKATTSERLGFTGRQEGIAAFATVTLEVKRKP